MRKWLFIAGLWAAIFMVAAPEMIAEEKEIVIGRVCGFCTDTESIMPGRVSGNPIQLSVARDDGNVMPTSATIWLLVSGLIGIVGIRRQGPI